MANKYALQFLAQYLGTMISIVESEYEKKGNFKITHPRGGATSTISLENSIAFGSTIRSINKQQVIGISEKLFLALIPASHHVIHSTWIR